MNVYLVTDGYFRTKVRANSKDEAIDYALTWDLVGCDPKSVTAKVIR